MQSENGRIQAGSEELRIEPENWPTVDTVELSAQSWCGMTGSSQSHHDTMGNSEGHMQGTHGQDEEGEFNYVRVNCLNKGRQIIFLRSILVEVCNYLKPLADTSKSHTALAISKIGRNFTKKNLWIF